MIDTDQILLEIQLVYLVDVGNGDPGLAFLAGIGLGRMIDVHSGAAGAGYEA